MNEHVLEESMKKIFFIRVTVSCFGIDPLCIFSRTIIHPPNSAFKYHKLKTVFKKSYFLFNEVINVTHHNR